MRSIVRSRPARRILFCAAAAALFSASALAASAADRKVVRTEDDLPRFSYRVTGTATQLLTADDATFNTFAAKVGADVDQVLANYDVQDHATLRELLSTRLAVQVLAGQDKAALDTVAQIKALEDKPDAK